MKTIHNIFSRQKEIIKKELPKIKIIADYRERNCLVASELVSFNFQIEFQELKVADYIVKNTAIERKTIQDFICSMKNKHLSNQLEELQQYENRLLIIEGVDEQELYSDSKDWNGMHPNSIRGFLLSILLKHKVPIIFTKNYKDTAKFISVLARKQEGTCSLNAKKKSFNKKEQLQFIIEGFPGIGPTTAKKLLKKFKSIKNIINASEKELKKILGKKAEITKKIIEQNY